MYRISSADRLKYLSQASQVKKSQEAQQRIISPRFFLFSEVLCSFFAPHHDILLNRIYYNIVKIGFKGIADYRLPHNLLQKKRKRKKELTNYQKLVSISLKARRIRYRMKQLVFYLTMDKAGIDNKKECECCIMASCGVALALSEVSLCYFIIQLNHLQVPYGFR